MQQHEPTADQLRQKVAELLPIADKYFHQAARDYLYDDKISEAEFWRVNVIHYRLTVTARDLGIEVTE